jgi:phosphatidylserine decarboxylase
VTVRSAIARIVAQEDLNFLLTNRIPRLALTRFMGRFARIEQPIVRRTSIALWRLFSDVDLSDARDVRFASLHAAFIRALRPGARVIDPDPAMVTSPCDAIVGAHGRIEAGRLHQIKGFPYTLADLLGEDPDATPFRDGSFVTLRLTAAMYHRFHAPHDLTVERVRYIAGDTWNVNPIALKRIERLFCKNERAPISVRLTASGHPLMLVPVAAVLVASIRLPFLDAANDVRSGGPRTQPCRARFAKGDEMGWFEHGSTILLLAPPGFAICDGIAEGQTIRMGAALLRLPEAVAMARIPL